MLLFVVIAVALAGLFAYKFHTDAKFKSEATTDIASLKSRITVVEGKAVTFVQTAAPVLEGKFKAVESNVVADVSKVKSAVTSDIKTAETDVKTIVTKL